jgi:gluconate 2-dehydrogenase gamma chain
MSKKISRRQMLYRTAIYGGSAAVALHFPHAVRAAQESNQPLVLSASEWRTVEAITGRIIPTDHEPGAIEAGCVNFIDKALANEDSDLRVEYREGVRGLDRVSNRRFGRGFAALETGEQDEVIAALESGRADGWPDGEVSSSLFFETVRNHTVLGFLADPKYGGNRDHAGWKVMGYPGPRHRFGGYTTEQTRGEADIPTVWGGKLPR